MSSSLTCYLAVAVIAVANAELSCYVGESFNGKLESNMTMTGQEWVQFYTSRRGLNPAQYKEPSFCQKSHTRSTVVNRDTGETSSNVLFSWGASEPRLTQNEVWKCNDNPQSTHGLRLPDSDVVIYNHQCNCCGNKCNGKQMDGTCNETPAFTKSCYTGGFDAINTDGKAPADAQEVPATANQFCYKLSHHNETSGETFYMWGATNLGSGNKCGDSRRLTSGSSTIQVCTCCGDKCNGADMDWIQGDSECTKPVVQSSANAIAGTNVAAALLVASAAVARL